MNAMLRNAASGRGTVAALADFFEALRLEGFTVADTKPKLLGYEIGEVAFETRTIPACVFMAKIATTHRARHETRTVCVLFAGAYDAERNTWRKAVSHVCQSKPGLQALASWKLDNSFKIISHQGRPIPHPGAGIRGQAVSVSGSLPQDVVEDVVRRNYGRIRGCYERGLREDPQLQGRVTVRFVIGRDGRVANVGGGGDLPNASVVSCVTRAFYGLTFPKPEGGIVTVSYPVVLTPGD